MTGVVVRGIWGNALAARRHERPPNFYSRMLQSVKDMQQRNDHYDQFYCFGADNAEFLRYHGINAICLSRHAWATPKIHAKFHHRWDGAWIHGYSQWWHKFKIVEAALQCNPSVLWIDVDARQIAPLPSDFWTELNQGPDVRASLYLQRNWSWGAGWRHARRWDPSGKYLMQSGDTHRAARIVPGCGYVRFKGLDVIREILELQQEHPFWLDHQILAFFLDRRHGGWIGEKAYCELGYHTQRYYYGRQLYRPAIEDVVWQAGNLGEAPVE